MSKLDSNGVRVLTQSGANNKPACGFALNIVILFAFNGASDGT